MFRMLIVGTIAALISLPAGAEESQVKGWKGLEGREALVFKAKVVDILCELAGDCPANCGNGKRQLGLVRADDGKLILASKNAQAAFQGAHADLYPFCGQPVKVDGLMVGDPERVAAKFFQVHFIQAAGSDEWIAAKNWTNLWKKEFPDAAAKKGRWYRNDPRIIKQIEARGYLGLGVEFDKEWIKENY